MSETRSISVELVLDLVVPGDAPLPVTARFGYRAQDPYAITLDFLVDGGEWITWTFARGLLDEGLLSPAGDGDVRIWPGAHEERRCAYLHTSSPHGAATFVLPLAQTAEFLLNTYALVPSGCEADHLDLDATVALLLAG